jgi:hypothetical protein
VSPIADWYLNQLATHGVAVVLAAQAAALAATWGGIGAALNANARHTRSRKEK